MTTTSHGTLALAASLATLQEGELRELLQSRRIASPANVTDSLGLAIELLRSESIHHGLQHLDRTAIAVLRAFGEGEDLSPEHLDLIDSLRRRGLVGLSSSDSDPAPEALPEVTRAVSEVMGKRGETAGSPGTGQSSVEHTTAGGDAASWFGPALAAVSRSAALIRALERHPIALSRKAELTVAAQRSLAEMTHDTPERAGQLAGVLRRARLAGSVVHHGGQPILAATEHAQEWLTHAIAQRWVALADALTSSIPSELRHCLRTPGGLADLRRTVEEILPVEFPLIPEADQAAALEWVRTAELLGLTVDGHPSPALPALLSADSSEALRIAERDFPPTAGGIYLQPDLSVVVPGPLSPSDESTLARIAHAEHLGVASTFRLSAASLSESVVTGAEISEIREFLERLSLTGLPQPLDYLLTDLERKQQAGDLPRRAARSAFLAESPDEPNQTSELNRNLEGLLERVLDSVSSSGETGDLSRRLELAIRHKSTVRVVATAGHGKPIERAFTVLPVSLTAGRLRATDQAAGVERTLPLSAIVAVEAVK